VPRPSSPPGAKASTECPYHTPIQLSGFRDQVSERTGPETDNGAQSSSAQNPDFIRSLRRTDIVRINSHNVSEHSLSDLGA
jgi:hypothetical protein